jgi:3-dehydroquinate synthetase
MVELGPRSYPVLIGDGVARQAGDFVAGAVLVVRDRNAPRLLEVAAPELILDGGESCKTMDGLARVLGEFERQRLGRDSTVLAVGGGSLTDLVGFAAAIWQRGIALVNVPTTLLGMVDAAVGGKTGINSATSKNAIGAFWQPRAVLCDLRALATLPPAEIDSAYAEVVKYDMTLDPGVAEAAGVEEVVTRSVAAKARVVAGDERESGAREVLNYGHTAGHAIEAATGYRLRHGCAVAAGMQIAVRLSARLGRCDDALVGTQDRLLAAHRLPGRLPSLRLEDVLDRLAADKKTRRGRARWVLLAGRGIAETGCDVPEGLVAKTVAEIIKNA